MKKAVLAIFVIAGLVFRMQAQNDPQHKQVERAYETFKQEFRHELDGDRGNGGNAASEDVRVTTFAPAVTLPAWMCNDELNRTGYHTAIGISDPAMDSADALAQARLRALALLALCSRSDIQNISDNYYLDEQGSKTLGKFNSFTSISATGSYDPEWVEQRDVDYTANGEAIVMLAMPEGAMDAPACSSIGCEVELFQSETGRTVKAALVTRLIFKITHTGCDGEPSETTWQLNENSSALDITSDWNGKLLQPPQRKYKYLGSNTGGSPQETTEAPFAGELRYGLWYGYLSVLTAQLEQLDVFDSQVKNLDDNFYHQYQNLTRVIASNSIRFDVQAIRVDDNKMMLTISKSAE